VDVDFGREVEAGFDPVVKHAFDSVGVADVALNKSEPVLISEGGHVLRSAFPEVIYRDDLVITVE
jgi:hypothetical protein